MLLKKITVLIKKIYTYFEKNSKPKILHFLRDTLADRVCQNFTVSAHNTCWGIY